MLVVAIHDRHHLTVIHYSVQEGRDSFDGLPECCVNFTLATTAKSAAMVSQPFTLGVIKEEVITINLAVDEVELLTYDPGVAVNMGMEAVEQARTKLGEAKYNLFWNNCESFVNWAITEKKKSNQGEAGMAAAGITVGVIGAIAVGIGAFFLGRQEKKK